MSSLLLIHFFLLFVSSPVLCVTHKKVSVEDIELDIRDKIVLDLGMKQRPDYEHANISVEEYNKMLKVYQQSVQQTKSMRELR